MIRRDQFLSAVAFAANAFLKSANWQDAMDAVLAKFGTAAGANRAYFFQNDLRDDGVVTTSQIAEWCAPGIEQQIDNPDLQAFPFVEAGMGRWTEVMAKGQPIHGLIADFPETEREVLEAQDIRSLVVMPVFSQNKWVGFLGFDDCERLREWTSVEMDGLFAAATALGAAIDRNHLEQQLRFSQKMEAIGRLASGLAHEFNNVLQAIEGLTAIAKLKIDKGDDAQQDLDEVLQASNRAASLTRQLLVFSRKQDQDFQVVDLSEVCNSAATMIKPMLGGSIVLTLDVVDPAPTVFADAGLFVQVLVNLCLNAREAMPGGGTLEISCDTTKMADRTPLDEQAKDVIATTEASEYACVTVRDTGCGMDAEVREQIFEPFYTTKDNGTGLGLSIAYGTVKQCGGFIKVESTLNQGTVFRIYVPIMERSPGPKVVGQGATGSETILFVDDELLIRQIIQRLLESMGYRVLTADNGRTGLEVYKNHQHEIDVVLTDLLMPEMDGVAMIESIFQQNPEVKTILISGCVVNLSDSVLCKGTVVLQKPIRKEALELAIRSVLD